MKAILASVIALVAALGQAAAAPEHSLATTALVGPRQSPLDDHCNGLSTDDPRTADPAQRCERAYATTLAGREVAVVQTTATPFDGGPGVEFDLLWPAIRSEVGWFVAPPVRIETSRSNGTGTVSSGQSVTSIAARGATLAGRPAVLFEIQVTRTESCRVCEPDVKRPLTRSTGVIACQIGPVGIACTEPLWFDGRVAPVRARGGRLEIDRDGAVVRGVYTLSPP